MSLCKTCGDQRNACERCLGKLEQRVIDLTAQVKAKKGDKKQA